MADNTKVMSSIKKFLLKLKAVDELPEELAQDALEMTEEVKDALEEENNFEEKKELEKETEDGCGVKDEDEEKNIEKTVEDSIVKVLRKYGVIRDSAMKSLDELEEECDIVTDEDSEEEVTVDPEVINNDSARRELIRQIKPVIAGVKDSKQRKLLSDAFAKALKMQKNTTVDYAAIEAIKKSNAKDSIPNTNANVDLGLEWAKKFNPHYKED